jgi:hypothetical protein
LPTLILKQVLKIKKNFIIGEDQTEQYNLIIYEFITFRPPCLSTLFEFIISPPIMIVFPIKTKYENDITINTQKLR